MNLPSRAGHVGFDRRGGGKRPLFSTLRWHLCLLKSSLLGDASVAQLRFVALRYSSCTERFERFSVRTVPLGKGSSCLGLFKGGGVTEGGGFDTAVRGTMFVRDGAVTSRPSRTSATSPLLRDEQNLRNNCVTVQWRRAGRRASPYRHPG